MFGHHSVQGRGQGDQGPREVQVTPEQVKGRLPETPVAPHRKHLNHSSSLDAVSGQGSGAEGAALCLGPGQALGLGVDSALERSANCGGQIQV